MTDTITRRLEPGDTAPPFTLQNKDGDEVSLADFAGSRVILYFYPAASTPGCTTEACDFRDNLASLGAEGYVVLGVSPDDLPALQTFAAEQSLSFPLLADAGHRVAEAYGAWGEKARYGKMVVGLIRSTFVIDERGIVTLALYDVKATGHVASLRTKLGIG